MYPLNTLFTYRKEIINSYGIMSVIILSFICVPGSTLFSTSSCIFMRFSFAERRKIFKSRLREGSACALGHVLGDTDVAPTNIRTYQDNDSYPSCATYVLPDQFTFLPLTRA